MSCCVGQASLGGHLTVCVVCYAAKDWHAATKKWLELKRVCSQTQLCQLRCLVTILDTYMFRPLLAIFRLSLRELKVLLYTGLL